VPSDPPSHAQRVAAARAAGTVHEQTVAGADHWTGKTAEDDMDAADAVTPAARPGAAFGL
jgi:hypothetical protein